MIRRILWTVVLSAAVSPAMAQQETPAVQEGAKGGETPTGFLGDETYPFEGEITVERLNVRLFPKGDPNASVIATVLGPGDKVTVVGELQDFFQVLPPRGTSVWVFARNVKKEGEWGVVLTPDTPVRLDSRVNAEKLASLNEGVKVQILKENMGWYQIASPEAVKYFVAKKYVKMLGKVAPTETVTPTPEAETQAKAALEAAEKLATEQHALIAAKQLKELDFAKVAAAFEAAAALATSEPLRKEAESEAKAYRQLQAFYVGILQTMDDAEKRIDALQKKIEAKDKPTETPWDFTGYVDTVGMLLDRPGQYKLVMGGKIICFLKVKEDNEEMIRRVNSLYEKYVGVRGTVVKLEGRWEGYRAVIIDSIEQVVKSSP